jgi:hypothetical protein
MGVAFVNYRDIRLNAKIVARIQFRKFSFQPQSRAIEREKWGSKEADTKDFFTRIT